MPPSTRKLSIFNLSFILETTRRDFTERFAGSVLGSVWAIIWPIVNLFIYIVIFGKIMGARLPDTSEINAYGIYLAAGLIPWTAFSATITRCTSVFIDKKHIITKVNTSLAVLLVQIVLSETITYLISMGVFLLILVFQGHDFHRGMLLLPALYLLQQMLALGLGLLAAMLNVFIRDVKEITGVILQLWFWFTPIVYIPDILPGPVQQLLTFNPAWPIVLSCQRVFILNAFPPLQALLKLTILTLVLLLTAFGLLRVLEKDIRDFL